MEFNKLDKIFKLCIFGGTIEGRTLASALQDYPIDITLCVATKYGEELCCAPHVHTHQGRMTTEEMESFFNDNAFSAIVDSTHPFAIIVSENIKAAAQKCQLPIVKIIRNNSNYQHHLVAQSTSDVVEILNSPPFLDKRVLLTTGSKNILEYSKIENFKTRVFPRIMPLVASLQMCEEASVSPSNIIAMQGPFSVPMNVALIKEYGIQVLITKDSGTPGGFDEKLTAVAETQITAIILKRKSEDGIPLEIAKNAILKEMHKWTLTSE